MKFLILSENSNGPYPHMHYRPLGPMEVRRRIHEKGHDATIIDWFTRWAEEDLKQAITVYQPDVIALSTTFEINDTMRQRKVLTWAKETYPNLKIIIGGIREVEGHDISDGLIDECFLGRSMKMFDLWLDNGDMSPYIVGTNPMVYLNMEFDEIADKPIVPPFTDDDFYTEHDILGFELGVGCKFNCSFCNYEMRNSKITNLNQADKLHEFFKEANERWGITHFYAVDDTMNESEEKLQILADAFEGLDFHPQVSGFLRLDLVSGSIAKSEKTGSINNQLELLKRIQFQSVFFGIETFHPEASKFIRKKSHPGKPFETLAKLKEVCPDMYTVGGIIVGLVGDSKESILESTRKVIDENLINSLRFWPLAINRPNKAVPYSEHFTSDIENNPAEFGYNMIKSSNPKFIMQIEDEGPQEWESDWTTFSEAEKFTAELRVTLTGKTDLLINTEYSSMVALGTYKKCTNREDNAALGHRTKLKADMLKKSYMDQKIKFFKNPLIGHNNPPI